MYTLNQLEIFKRVADTGSFNKAAESAFVTPNAVMKQINNLEAELGVALFHRTFRGQVLTNAGECLYKRAADMLKQAKDIVQEVKDAARHDINKIRVGVSVMTPLEELNTLWLEIKRRYPDIKIEIVTFENNPTNDNLYVVPVPGAKVDIVVDSFDSLSLAKLESKGLAIAEMQMHAVVSMDHRLAEKELIEIEDLNNETIIRRKGMMQYIDEFCEELDSRELNITYHEVASYSTDTYNELAAGNEVMVGIGNLRNVHPFLKRIPINWSKKCDFGIIYSAEPTSAVRIFIGIVEEIVSERQ